MPIDKIPVVGLDTGAPYWDSSGNVGIGTSSPSYKLDVTGQGRATTGFAVSADGSTFTPSGLNAIPNYGVGYITSTSQTALSGFGGIPFYTNQVERARIDSSGQFLVGNTVGVSSGGRAQVVQTDQGNAALSVDATNASFDYNVLFLNTTRAASSAFDYIQCDSGGYAAAQFRVRGDGVIFAQNTTVQSISDARTKENVRDANEGLDTILGLRPVRFDFKEGFGNNRKNQLGFIAQEVEPIFPDAVDVAGELDENGEPYKSVGPSAMIPVLVKAIQELKAEVEALQAEVAALKGA